MPGQDAGDTTSRLAPSRASDIALEGMTRLRPHRSRRTPSAGSGVSDLHVLHMIHETSFGGVETAAENLRLSLGSGARSRVGGPMRTHELPVGAQVLYRVAALEESPAEDQVVRADVAGRSVNSPLAAMTLLREVRRTQPDILITSLWRSLALGALSKVLSPRSRWAIWVHLSRYKNPLDRLVHEWCLPRADAVLCDSEATYKALVRPRLAQARSDVPMHLVRPEAAPLPVRATVSPPRQDEPLRLVFWGRLARQKRLDLAIELIAELRKIRPGGAELLLIGPDSGELAALREQVVRLHLDDDVRFEPPLDRDGLADRAARSHVFVQLSDAEGFAMSAHEALALGMVSVLTPVGDLASDTQDDFSSIHHHGDVHRTARRLTDLVADPDAFSRIAQNARGTGDGEFISSFVDSCLTISRRGNR